MLNLRPQGSGPISRIPISRFLIPGRVADCRAAEDLLRGLPHNALVIVIATNDTGATRQQIEEQGTVPNIPSKRTRIWQSCF